MRDPFGLKKSSIKCHRSSPMAQSSTHSSLFPRIWARRPKRCWWRASIELRLSSALAFIRIWSSFIASAVTTLFAFYIKNSIIFEITKNTSFCLWLSRGEVWTDAVIYKSEVFASRAQCSGTCRICVTSFFFFFRYKSLFDQWLSTYPAAWRSCHTDVLNQSRVLSFWKLELKPVSMLGSTLKSNLPGEGLMEFCYGNGAKQWTDQIEWVTRADRSNKYPANATNLLSP